MITAQLAPRHIVLSVLFFQEAQGVWVAQALERDIAAYGPDLAQAKRAFERTVSGYLVVAEQQHLEPLASLKPAPTPFWEAWIRLVESTPLVERMPSIPAFMMPAVSYDPIQA
jgi:hypothetical protein